MRCRVTLYSCFRSSSLGRERPFSGARVTSAFPLNVLQHPGAFYGSTGFEHC